MRTATIRPAQRPLQRHRRVERDDAAVIEQGHVVAALGLVHVGRGDEHGNALGDHLVDDEPEVAARDGIHAERGFVEQEDLRLVDEGAAEAEFLLHPAGELAGQPALELAEVRELI